MVLLENGVGTMSSHHKFPFLLTRTFFPVRLSARDFVATSNRPKERERERESYGTSIQACIITGGVVPGFAWGSCGRRTALCFGATEHRSCAPVSRARCAHCRVRAHAVPADICINRSVVHCDACGMQQELVGAGQEIVVQVDVLCLVPLPERPHALHHVLLHLHHGNQRALPLFPFASSSFLQCAQFLFFTLFVFLQCTSHRLCMRC